MLSINLIMNCQVYPESTHNSVFLKGPDVESPVCSDSINSSDLVLSSCPVSLHELFVSSVPVNAFGFEPSVHPISANTLIWSQLTNLLSVQIQSSLMLNHLSVHLQVMCLNLLSILFQLLILVMKCIPVQFQSMSSVVNCQLNPSLPMILMLNWLPLRCQLTYLILCQLPIPVQSMFLFMNCPLVQFQSASLFMNCLPNPFQSVSQNLNCLPVQVRSLSMFMIYLSVQLQSMDPIMNCLSACPVSVSKPVYELSAHPVSVSDATGRAVMFRRYRTRRRGKRASALVKLCLRGLRMPLPSIHLANFRSLPNKTLDELLLLSRTNKDFSNSAALCFTETWLNDTIPDSVLHLFNFQLIRADREAESTGKLRGGGLLHQWEVVYRCNCVKEDVLLWSRNALH